MTQLVQYLLLGLGTGAVYALTAQGLVVVYRGAGVINFAQGGLGMVGAYLFYEGRAAGWPMWFACVVAIGAPMALGAAVHLGLMARLHQASPLVRLTMTLAVLFVFVAVAEAVWSEDPTSVASPLPDHPVQLLGTSIQISADRIVMILLACAATLVLWLVYGRSRFGRATTATAENPAALAALGWSPDLIASINWAVGAGLAAVGSVLIAPILQLHAISLSFVVLRSLAAALVGRFESFGRTLAGAFAIGVGESLVARYLRHDGVLTAVTSDDGLFLGSFSAQSVARSLAFLVIVVGLAVRGRSIPIRGAILDRLPSVGDGVIRPWWFLVALVAAGAALMTANPSWATSMSISLAFGMILLSLVVVTGYGGQLSLAQVALGGFGAWVAGRLVDSAGWSFPAAFVAAVLVTVPVGLVVALPALRTRGVSLGIVTFGLSVVIFELVLANRTLTGEFAGTRVGQTELFGWSIDTFRHADRYGLVVLGVFAAGVLLVASVRRGATGRALLAVRDNERAAAALGISPYGTKLFAFAIGSALAAAGGVLLAFHQETLNFAQFAPHRSVEALLSSVIGGVGYLTGPLIGSLFVAGGIGTRLGAAWGGTERSVELLSAGILIVVLLRNPNGVASSVARAAQRRARAPRSEAPPGPPTVHARAVDAAGVRAASEGRAEGGLEVEHLRVAFGGVVAVRDVSLSVRDGEIVGLIGPNGAGKSTVIDCVTGFVDGHGVVRLDGGRIDGLSPARRARRRLGRTFQTLELFEDLSVLENLLVASDCRSRRLYLSDLVHPGPRALSEHVAALVASLGLAPHLGRLPGELSHGQRRLLAIGRALAADPSVLLLDEPAAGLSESETAELAEVILRLAHEHRVGVLLVEHDMDMVMSICDRVVVLESGRLIAEGTPAAIADDAAVHDAYLGAVRDPGDVATGVGR